MNGYMDEVVMGTMVCIIFDKAKDVCQLKWLTLRGTGNLQA